MICSTGGVISGSVLTPIPGIMKMIVLFLVGSLSTAAALLLFQAERKCKGFTVAYPTYEVGGCWQLGSGCVRMLTVNVNSAYRDELESKEVKIPEGMKVGLFSGAGFEKQDFLRFCTNLIPEKYCSDGLPLVIPDQLAVWSDKGKGFLIYFSRG